VWVSDGTTWNRVPDGPFARVGQQLVAIVAAPDGFVAVGFDSASGDRDAAVWASREGRTWERLSSASFGGPGDQEMNGVAFLPGLGFVAVGDVHGVGKDGAVWTVKAGGVAELMG
jgi:molecular chaperone DnaK